MHEGQGKGMQRAGVIGTEGIANRFMPEVRLVSGICVKGVYNPTRKAWSSCARWGIEAYGDLTEFFREIDLVYVASLMKHIIPISRQPSRGKTCVVKASCT